LNAGDLKIIAARGEMDGTTFKYHEDQVSAVIVVCALPISPNYKYPQIASCVEWSN
jgi:hypothetical protein